PSLFHDELQDFLRPFLEVPFSGALEFASGLDPPHALRRLSAQLDLGIDVRMPDWVAQLLPEDRRPGFEAGEVQDTQELRGRVTPLHRFPPRQYSDRKDARHST